MRHLCFRISVLAVALAAAGAPAHAGKKELQAIALVQGDVEGLQRQVLDLRAMVETQSQQIERLLKLLGESSETRRQWAEFNANVDALRGDISRLGERFDETTERLRGVETRLDARRPPASAEAILGGHAGEAPGAATAPMAAAPETAQALYNQAYADYVNDAFDLAISQFRDYTSRYPSSDLADNSQYWIAMSLYNQGKHDEAVREFDILLDLYPQADNTPEALYRKGLGLAELNRLGQAVLVLNEVVSRYPGTGAARQAQTKLAELARSGG